MSEFKKIHGRWCIKSSCLNCGAVVWTRQTISKFQKFCSISCSSTFNHKLRDQRGSKNGNWRGGITSNHYHYKKIQIQRYPERVSARHKVRMAIKSGKLVRMPCYVCGNKDSFAHHEDYSISLDVDWYCRPCHRLMHDGKH